MMKRYMPDLTHIRKAEEAARLTPEDFKNIASGFLSLEGLSRHMSANYRRSSDWNQSLHAAGHCSHAKRELSAGEPARVTCSGFCPWEDAAGLPSSRAACHLVGSA